MSEGSELLYHGQSIGKVTGVDFNGTAGFHLKVFVFQPYDALVKPGTRFWRISPQRFSLAGGGLNATLAPASTLLSGGIDWRPTRPTRRASPVPLRPSSFCMPITMPRSRDSPVPSRAYEFAFQGAAGQLQKDAPVTLLGFQVGEVEEAHLAYDGDGQPFTVATAAIYPRKLSVDASAGEGTADWQTATDKKYAS